MSHKPRWVDVVEGDWDVDQDGQVHSALLTTYEPPSGDFLVEELFPNWFGLDTQKSSTDDTSFASQVRVMDALKSRRDRISIFFSSVTQGENAKHWVWSHLRSYPVGATRSMTQHAKLWMLHRIRGDGSEWLDLRVSSLNLTQSALDGQLQAGVRIVSRLASKSLKANRDSWGVLGDFLKELGRHSGPEGPAGITPFLALLGRAAAPKGMKFIASVPGRHSGSRWGVKSLGAALQPAASLEMDVLVPTVGRWQSKELQAWCAAAGIRPRNIRLAWIRDGHDWASKWAMPAAALAAAKAAGVRIVTAPAGEGFAREKLHSQFDDKDRRWSHAKIYWFKRGAKLQALVTSANWSSSAWGRVGKDGLVIENFELGVLFPVTKRALSTAPPLSRTPATREDDDRKDDPAIWAYATFDGKKVKVYLRTSRPMPGKMGVIDVEQGRTELPVDWRREQGLHVCTRAWQGSAPSFVVLLFPGEEERWICPQDLRTAQEAEKSPLGRPPGLSAEDLERMLAALLEERYGGGPLESLTPTGKKRKGAEPADGGAAGNYRVETLDRGRELAAIVDKWADELAGATHKDLRKAILRDGHLMLAAWRAEITTGGPRAIPLVIAADDLAARLGA